MSQTGGLNNSYSIPNGGAYYPGYNNAPSPWNARQPFGSQMFYNLPGASSPYPSGLSAQLFGNSYLQNPNYLNNTQTAGYGMGNNIGLGNGINSDNSSAIPSIDPSFAIAQNTKDSYNQRNSFLQFAAQLNPNFTEQAADDFATLKTDLTQESEITEKAEYLRSYFKDTPLRDMRMAFWNFAQSNPFDLSSLFALDTRITRREQVMANWRRLTKSTIDQYFQKSSTSDEIEKIQQNIAQLKKENAQGYSSDSNTNYG